MQISGIFCVNDLGTFSGRLQRWACSSGARAGDARAGAGVREGIQRGRGGRRGPSVRARQARAGVAPHHPELASMPAGKLLLVLSDVPLLQDDLSLPGRQLGLVVAQRPQLLGLLFLPLHLLPLLSLLLLPRHGVRARPQARMRGRSPVVPEGGGWDA